MNPSLPKSTLYKAEQQAALFRAFGHPRRLLILWLLLEQERTLHEIADAIGIPLMSASHHINILEFQHLIHSSHEKGTTHYQLVEPEILLNCRIFENKPEIMFTDINQNSSNPS